MSELPLMLDWRGLKQTLGHVFSRQHTYRMMNADEYDPPFPRPVKPMAPTDGAVDRSRAVWSTREVLAWYKARGLTLGD